MSISLLTKGMISPTIFQLYLSDLVIASLDSGNISCEDCSELSIKIGNSITLNFLVSANGVRLTQSQLQAADNIIFAVKRDSEDANEDAVILKELPDGIIILPDMDNASPNVQVTLIHADTLLKPGSYSCGLQINFSDEDIKEASLQFNEICFNSIYFTQDVVR